MDPNGLETRAHHCEDDLGLLRGLPAECVDLVYLDPAFDWIAAPLDDLHRILRPNGALFLVCDESVGPFVRAQLDRIFSQRNASARMVWWKADTGPAHHYVFYCRKSDDIGRHGHLYTVIHREGEGDSSLVAFSFLQGRPRRRVS